MTIDQMKLELERLEAKAAKAWDVFRDAKEEAKATLKPLEDEWHALYVAKNKLAAAVEWMERELKEEVTSNRYTT